MMDRSVLPTISSILSWLDVPLGRRGRTVCPIHHGENNQAFSYNDERGVWYCFRCGFGGDAVELVKRSMDTDFKGALRWLGIRPGPAPATDPAKLRQQRVREGLQIWAHQTQRNLRDQHYLRSQLEIRAKKRLHLNPEDPIGWDLLSIAYRGMPLDELEEWLELLNGREPEQIQAYKTMKGMT